MDTAVCCEFRGTMNGWHDRHHTGSPIINTTKTPQSVFQPVDDGPIPDGDHPVSVIAYVRLSEAYQELSEPPWSNTRRNPDPTWSGVPNFTEGDCV
jgi:hypothetical protein